MPKIVITHEYVPNLDDYPTWVENVKDAMIFDVNEINNGNAYVEELIEGGGKTTIEVVD